MTPIIGDLINITVGNVVGVLMAKYLPSSMSESEKAQFKRDAERLMIPELEASKSIIDSVNATMQAEAKSEGWGTRNWRPYWGFISGTVYGVVGIVLSIAIIKLAWADPDKLFAQLPMIIGAFATYFSIAGAVLGITAWHRGKKQRIQAGEAWGEKEQAGLLQQVKELLKK